MGSGVNLDRARLRIAMKQFVHFPAAVAAPADIADAVRGMMRMDAQWRARCAPDAR